MMPWLALLGLIVAHAEDRVVVQAGQTPETLARSLGVPAEALRALNGLGPTDQPPVGAVLRVPGGGEVQAREGEVLALTGRGTLALGDGRSAALAVGQAVPLGAEVCTGPGSMATVRVRVASCSTERDDLLLHADTCLHLDAASSRPGERSTLVTVTRGSVSVQSADDVPGKVTVVTPSGVTVGDAGGYRVSIEAGATRTEAPTAPVSVIGAGRQVDLLAGQGTRVRTGEAPEAPVDLLSPGSPLAPAAGAVLRRPDFSWTPVPGALGYRVELAEDPEFGRLVVAELADDVRWSPELLFLDATFGEVWWRVTAVDRAGFFGEPSAPRPVRLPGTGGAP